MRLAVSNIAWPSGADEEAAAILVEAGVTGVEVAPTKVWPRPVEATAAEVAAYRDAWERRGLPIVALQALLFGRADLTIFDDPATRDETRSYLERMIDLAAALGAGALVFGSPKNRLVGGRSPDEAEAIAVPFFRALGEHADRLGVRFCIEPNPTDYGCDYVTTAMEGAALVGRVDSPGFRLHLDAAGMTLAGDPIGDAIRESAHLLGHFHISEPFLGPVGPGAVDHPGIAGALRSAGYPGWLSIEMKEAPGEDRWRAAIRDAANFTVETYGEGR